MQIQKEEALNRVKRLGSSGVKDVIFLLEYYRDKFLNEALNPNLAQKDFNIPIVSAQAMNGVLKEIESYINQLERNKEQDD